MIKLNKVCKNQTPEVLQLQIPKQIYTCGSVWGDILEEQSTSAPFACVCIAT